MLAKVSEPIQHSDWTRMLVKAEYALNNSVHSTTRQTPCMLLFGVNQRGREVDRLTEFLDEKHDDGTNRNLESLRDNAATHIHESQEKNLSFFQKKHKPAMNYSVGEFVVIRNVDTSVGTNKKFIPKYKGPYRVHKVLPNDRYVIRDIENAQISQIPYDGIIEASRLKHWADWRDSYSNSED